MVVLRNIFKKNREIPWSWLKSVDPPRKLVDAWSLETLAENMATQNAFPVPNTFARARTLLREVGQDIKECFVAGVLELGLQHQILGHLERKAPPVEQL